MKPKHPTAQPRDPESTQICDMDPSAWTRICRHRVREGDYDPLWQVWGRMRMIRDPRLTQGIPDHWSHPLMVRYLSENDWDVGTIPNDRIAALAERIEQRLDEREGSQCPP